MRLVDSFTRMLTLLRSAMPNGTFSTSLMHGYSVMGAFHHYFTPNFSDVLFGSYLHTEYGNRARNTDWTLGGLGDGSEYRIGNQFIWTPVNNLSVGIEVIYMHIDQTLAHNPGAAAYGPPGRHQEGSERLRRPPPHGARLLSRTNFGSEKPGASRRVFRFPGSCDADLVRQRPNAAGSEDLA